MTTSLDPRFALLLAADDSQSWLEIAKGYASAYGPNLLWAAATLLIGWWAAGLLSNVVRRFLRDRQLDGALVGFLSSIAHALLLALVIISALDRLGVPTTSFVAVVGAAGLAVGFALQGSLANFASGVMIVFFRPFKAGDLIEAAGVLGKVLEVQIFASTLVTLDNRKIIVPNSTITGGNIVNYSAMETRRVDLVIGVSYGADLKQTREVIVGVLARHPMVLKDPAATVAVSELAESSVNFVVRPWCKTADYWDVYFEITEQLKLALDEAGIQIPFPQRDVHLHQVA